MNEEPNFGRHSTDADLAVLAQWRSGVDDKLQLIYEQTVATNGRVTELEKREYIRKDREEQKAIRDAATEAAKYRVEQQELEAETLAETLVVEKYHHRVTWKVMIAAACAGGAIDALVHVVTGK